jgi:ADP-dependent NAD(P)H-hydrate dehydratase / NAD(P)H-hydrate epimerase
MEQAAAGMLRALEDAKLLSYGAPQGRRGRHGEPEAGPDDGSSGRPTIVALCGRGNNAGDALAMLRMAAFRGAKELYAIVPPGLGSEAAKRALEARAAGVMLIEYPHSKAQSLVEEAGLVLDALTGTGLKGRLREPLAGMAALAEAAQGRVVAVDLPSGVQCAYEPGAAEPSILDAERSLCVAPLKTELYYPGYRPHAGAITAIEGVFPSTNDDAASGAKARAMQACLLEPGDLGALLTRLDPDCHKGGRGAVGIYAGSVGGLGAAFIAARSSSAAGAGSVTLMLRDELYPVAATALSAQMIRPLSSGPGRRLDALLAGPGLGRDAAALELVEGLWRGVLPLVLDADALRLLARAEARPSGAPLVLTPHPGEFISLARLAAGIDPADTQATPEIERRLRFDTEAILRELCAAFGAVIALKGSVSWIGSPDGRLSVWDGRNPALATAGSGDALAGALAALLGSGAQAYDAARAAVIAHGLAGHELAVRGGFFDASSLPDALAPLLFKEATGG